MKRKQPPGIVIATLLLLSSFIVFPVQATGTFDWSKPRPSTYRTFSETIGNASTDGEAAVGIGVTIGEYVEDSPSHDYNDYLGLKVSVSANTRRGIDYAFQYPAHGFQWLEVSNPTGITGDDDGVWIDLSVEAGFSVLYYGVEYDKIWVCSNGFVSFTSECTDANPQTIPSNNTPNAIIAPFWRTLKPNRSGSITYGVRLFDIHEFFVVSWNNVPDANGNPQTFQLLIEIPYKAGTYEGEK